MVEDRITDGKRIGQLLASELTGLESPPLDRITVVDATPDVEPTADGATAYGVALDDDRIGDVTISPEYAVLSVSGTLSGDVESGAGIAVEGDEERIRIRIENGAAVKRAVDLLVEIVSE